jgi:hypothetical protein
MALCLPKRRKEVGVLRLREMVRYADHLASLSMTGPITHGKKNSTRSWY